MSDEVYVVNVEGREQGIYVFGHRSDADAFFEAAAKRADGEQAVTLTTTKVYDHADAAGLIEQEEG